jgi:hypothetical protein
MADSRTRLRGRPWLTSARFTRQVDAALKPMLTEDDHLIAGARVVSGPLPLRIALAGAVAGTAAGWVIVAVARHLVFAAAAPPVWVALLLALPPVLAPSAIIACVRRPMLVAISRQQLICARLTAFWQRPVSIVTMPLSASAIVGYRSSALSTSIAVSLPGLGLTRLHAIGSERQLELNDVMRLARAAGVPISATPRRTQRRPERTAPPDYGAALTGLPQWSRWPAD